MSRGRGEAGVELGRRRMRPQHRDVRRQVRIDAAHPRGQRPLGVGVEVNDLRRGVHTGVGASGRDDANGMAGDLADRVLERVLHAATRWLRLEAAERAACIFDTQYNTHGAFRIQVRNQESEDRKGHRRLVAAVAFCHLTSDF